MPASTHPNLPLKYGWTLGESGWHADMDANLTTLGAVVGLSAASRAVATPPASPTNGDRYIIPSGATGVWSGRTDQIAVRIGGAWEYLVPKVGWVCYIADEDKLAAYKTGGWSAGIAI